MKDYRKVLLRVSPMNDETTQGATEHQSFLQWLLSVFGKDSTHVAALIGDNASTNKA